MLADRREAILGEMQAAKRELTFLTRSVQDAEPGSRLVATMEQIQKLRQRTQTMVDEFLALSQDDIDRPE